METVLNPSLKEMAQAAINQKLILQGVSWEFYENVLAEFADASGVRFAYDDGFMEVQVPTRKHEKVNKLLSKIVELICEEQFINYDNSGSMTFRKQAKSKGCEPDTAFYIQNEKKIRGLEEIDLSKNPPPDLVIEVDVTSPSLNKMPIYSALQVPEIWLYKGEKVEFYKLYGEFYQEIENSLVFSRLSSAKATEFLQKGLTQSSTEWVRAIREWAKEKND